MMSFSHIMGDNTVIKMQSRIEELERALQRIGTAKKQLGHNTAEAKSRIQCNISRQLEALRNREVWLLNQLDTISGAKEEVLQQQSVRLNKSLGVLQSSVKYPNGSEGATSNIERMDLGDLQPEETPNVSFKSDPGTLREAILNYGRIDANSVTGIQSPFMDPDHQAPSLPRHFEDYNDAEHHILYKTVEELNRIKSTKQPEVSMAPKLSSRMEDWLMPVNMTTGNTTSTGCGFSLPKLSNNLSDWLIAPVRLNKEVATPIHDMSKDASIQTWLHKIKQCPMEEEDDDYEFIEDDSDIKTQSSELEQFPDLEEADKGMWLHRTGFKIDGPQTQVKQTGEESTDKWLLKSKTTCTYERGEAINMSQYFNKITDELDKWLLAGVVRKQVTVEEKECTRLQKPAVPSSLDLSNAIRSHVSRVDNPWLLNSAVHSNSISPVSSRRSSLSSSSSSKPKLYNKWLLNGDPRDGALSSQVSCSVMDKFKNNASSLSWLRTSQPSDPMSENPMSKFQKFAADSTMWLKTSDVSDVEHEGELFVKKPLDSGLDNWLQKSCRITQNEESPLNSDKTSAKDNDRSIWLIRSLSASPKCEDDIEEIEL